MDEAELRRSYNGERILIDVERIVEPAHDALGVYLSGAQVEMVRNVTDYLNRRSTFAKTYADGFYVMPDDSDWDAIQAIVADMEGKWMMTDNTLWGFGEAFDADLASLQGADGTATVSVDLINAGEVLVLEGVSWRNDTGERGRMEMYVKRGTIITRLAQESGLSAGWPILWAGRITLVEDDRIVVKQFNCLEDDAHTGAVWGYKMIVPV